MRRTAGVLAALLAVPAVFAVTPATESYLLSIGRGKGACVIVGGGEICAQWRTTVWIFNPSASQSAIVDIFLLERKSNPNPAVRRITVAPGETRHFPDILRDTFGITENVSVYGAFRLVSDLEVVVSGRIYDANVPVVGKPEAGSAGQFFPGMPAPLAIASGGSTSVPGLAQDVRWRSNLFLVETTGNAVSFRVERLDPAGTVRGSFTDSLGVREAKQYNRVLETRLGTSSAENQRLRVVVTGGAGAVLAGASLIDNLSGDPSTLEMITIGGATPLVGVFEGLVRHVTTGGVRGGMALTVGGDGLSGLEGVADIDCGEFLATLDLGQAFDADPVPLDAEGSFQVDYTIDDYQDPVGGGAVLTVEWTVLGQRGAGGVFTGSLTSRVTAASGEYTSCLGAMDSSAWGAGWRSASRPLAGWGRSASTAHPSLTRRPGRTSR